MIITVATDDYNNSHVRSQARIRKFSKASTWESTPPYGVPTRSTAPSYSFHPVYTVLWPSPSSSSASHDSPTVRGHGPVLLLLLHHRFVAASEPSQTFPSPSTLNPQPSGVSAGIPPEQLDRLRRDSLRLGKDQPGSTRARTRIPRSPTRHRPRPRPARSLSLSLTLLPLITTSIPRPPGPFIPTTCPTRHCPSPSSLRILFPYSYSHLLTLSACPPQQVPHYYYSPPLSRSPETTLPALPSHCSPSQVAPKPQVRRPTSLSHSFTHARTLDISTHPLFTLDSLETPPPLSHSPNSSDRGPSSTAESTPISTPLPQPASPHFPRHKRDDLLFSWHRKPNHLGLPTQHLLDDPDLLFAQDDNAADDCTFPLFESPRLPPPPHLPTMAQAATPLDITPPRMNSSSPQNQTSNLTFALQEAKANAARDASATPNHPNSAATDLLDARPGLGGRHGSISNGLSSSSFFGSGARPITMKDRPRRESNMNMGSFAGGMSWGGVSVGSWIRDE